MNSIFLRAKHWQIFVPLIAIPFVVMMIFGIIVGVYVINHQPQRPEDMAWIFYLMPFIMAAAGFVQFAWTWNVLTKLSKLIPQEKVYMPSGRIKTFFIIPVVYLCIVPLFGAFMISNIGRAEHGDPSGIFSMFLIGLLIFFMHLFSIFCMLHTFYFIAKTIRVAETQQNATFSDFAGDFFLTWFFPVGIWFLQPRINKLIENESPAPDEIDEYHGLIDG